MKKMLYLFVAVTLLMTVQPLSAKTHSGLVTLEVDLSAQPSGQPARLWIPYPVSDRDQVVKDIRWSGDYAVSGVYTDRTFGTPILRGMAQRGRQ